MQSKRCSLKSCTPGMYVLSICDFHTPLCENNVQENALTKLYQQILNYVSFHLSHVNLSNQVTLKA